MSRVPPPWRIRRRDQRGSAGALLVVGIALSVAVVFYSSMLLISWFAAARQAQQSAELAALAAAGAAVGGRPPCEAAALTAGRNQVDVARCTVHGTGRYVVVEIEVEVEAAATVPGAPATIRRSATAAS